jgi:hypothetical protein
MQKNNPSPYMDFATALIDKISDDIEFVIIFDNKDLEKLTNELIKLHESKTVNFGSNDEVINLIQFTEELYSIMFDFSQTNKDNLLDIKKPIPKQILKELDISKQNINKIVNMSRLIKILLNITLKQTRIQKENKSFQDDVYPVLIVNQSGGHLYNNKLGIIYLTKQSGGGLIDESPSFFENNYGLTYTSGGGLPNGQPTFYERNYGVNYATTGGALPENLPTFYERNYGVNYATTGGALPENYPTFYERNYGVNYATTGGGLPTFYERNYGVNYATTGGGLPTFYERNYATTGGALPKSSSTGRAKKKINQKGRGLPTDMDRVPGFYVRNYWD